MSNKLQSISIKGIRGIKNTLTLPLKEKSILIYGDNGNGKSSLIDSLEWFFTGDVKHLSTGEIDLKEALRNFLLPDSEDSYTDVEFSRSPLNNSKRLFLKKKKLLSDFKNSSTEIEKFFLDTSKENIFLRHRDLTDFIDSTKGQKLKSLGDIIGFGELTKTKETLQRMRSTIKNNLKSQNFEGQINTNKQILISKIGASVTEDDNLFNELNKILETLSLTIRISSFSDIDSTLTELKKSANAQIVAELQFLTQINSTLTNLKSEVQFLNDEYVKYYSEHQKFITNQEKLVQLFTKQLLGTANQILNRKIHKGDSCPLCQQQYDITKLTKEIQSRLVQVESYFIDNPGLENAKHSFNGVIRERISRIKSLLHQNSFSDEKYRPIKHSIDLIIEKLNAYKYAATQDLMSTNDLPNPLDICIPLACFDVLTEVASTIQSINLSLQTGAQTVAYSNISSAKEAYLSIKRLENEKAKLEIQRVSFDLIYSDFLTRQKRGLELFLEQLSSKINEYYQYMNPLEHFLDIKIVPILKENDLDGITIEYSYKNERVSPPQKYFSESHLNCLGIALFLASVVAFNNVNKFIVLDDVISSFDTNHRHRFALLLFEKFSDYQQILLTHESEWFNSVRPIAKKNGWIIKEIKWSEENGSFLDETTASLKERIEKSLSLGEISLIGNPMRTYLESFLKEVCIHLDVKVSFRLNDQNEKRMADELLNELKGRIKKSSPDLSDKISIIENVSNSAILGNLLSHDNHFTPKQGDLQAFWSDIVALEKLFMCQEAGCKRPAVSLQNYDNVAKKIRCGCDYTKYSWKK